jgi:hypothetical protein
MQACIRHAHIGEYYRDFTIPEDTSCPCGAELQTQIYILAECPLFDKHRHLLHDEEQNIKPTDLLAPKKESNASPNSSTKQMHSPIATRNNPIPHTPIYFSYKNQPTPPHTNNNTPHHTIPPIQAPLLNPTSPRISQETKTPNTQFHTPSKLLRPKGQACVLALVHNYRLYHVKLENFIIIIIMRSRAFVWLSDGWVSMAVI